MNPTIEDIKIKSPFRHLWLKYIQAVNLDVHCARSFVGHYETQINPKLISAGPIPLAKHQAFYYYLCGVSQPYRWENNFHLAFAYSEGNSIEFQQNGIEVVIANAVQLPIPQIGPDCDSVFRHRKEYNTCRNWQFAWSIRNLVPCKEYQKEMPGLF